MDRISNINKERKDQEMNIWFSIVGIGSEWVGKLNQEKNEGVRWIGQAATVRRQLLVWEGT